MALDTSDPNAVKQAAHDILNQPQFTSQRQTLWERVIYYMTHPVSFFSLVLSKILDYFVSSTVNVIFVSILTGVIAVAIIFVIIRFSRTTSRAGAVHIHYAPTVSNRSVSEILAEADALEREEKWPDVIRLRYSAVVQSLSEHGVVRARAGRTTGEYLQEVRNNAAYIAEDFGQATRVFEWIWYGKGDPARADVSEFKALSTSLIKKAAA